MQIDIYLLTYQRKLCDKCYSMYLGAMSTCIHGNEDTLKSLADIVGQLLRHDMF